MKRRSILKSMAAAPAAAVALPAQQAPPPADETPKLAVTVPEDVAAGVRRFFTPEQYAALEKLGEILVPKSETRPGAREARAAEFLDFLLSQSPLERQKLYREGLDRLNGEARKRAGPPFSDLNPQQADAVLAPLREPWTYKGSSDPFARFLRAAKEDIFLATVNSREFAAAASARSRAAAGTGTYWYPIE